VNPDARLGTKVLNVPLRAVGIRVVTKARKKKDGLVVICAEGTLVHCPEPVSRSILSEFNVNQFSCRWVWIWSYWKPRLRGGK
jgi:hypothetical protein